MAKGIRGVLFDMDGLMFDTERLWRNFFMAAISDLGYPADEHTEADTKGMCVTELAEYYGARFGAQAETLLPKLFDLVVCHKTEYFSSHKIAAKKGLYELLAFLHDVNIKCSVVTSSKQKDVEQLLAQAEIPNWFNQILDAAAFEKGKPEPDMYLAGSKALGLKPEECIVLEDTLSGLQAADAAGAVPVMIPDLVMPTQESMRLAQAVLPDLSGVIDLLCGWRS